ncbi:MAG: AraC family transcriptional regulator [Defluviitaleaceae bacterium]|nr:AraC family transcriptional regulator [Defluviitaleaceae bacterium]MCL2275744.1 AraC family transcriptional regulator [Defluviitaleaceae bacterium]
MLAYYFNNAVSTAHDYHYHDFYEIFFLLTGEDKSFFINDKIYLVKPNDIIFINKDLLHKSNYNPKEFSRVIIHFSDEFADSTLISSMAHLFANYVYTPKNPEAIQGLLHKMEAEQRKNDAFSPFLIKAFLLEILSLCVRNPSVYRYTSSLANPVIERLIRYVNAHFSQKLTLHSAAEMLRISEGHLSRLFAKTTGFTFNEYVNIIRIKHAKHLLSHTKTRISGIALECGFSDAPYFSKVFKTATGLSPKAFRHEMRR